VEILVVDRMRPNKLNRNLERVHAECVGKIPDFCTGNTEFN
jgi:hypothetical protein